MEDTEDVELERRCDSPVEVREQEKENERRVIRGLSDILCI
jgi:hypothetical protein